MSDELIERHRIAVATARLIEAGLVVGSEPVEGVCPCCEAIGQIAKRRLNTAYVSEECNWLISCEGCYQDGIEHFAELWDTYYHG
jgi:hypothetical protein